MVSLVTESSAAGIKTLGLSLLAAGPRGGRFLCCCPGWWWGGSHDSTFSARGMRSSDIQPELVAHLGFPQAPGSGVAPMFIGSCVGCPGELCPKL